MSTLDLKKDIAEAMQLSASIEKFGKKTKNITEQDKKDNLANNLRYKEITGVDMGPYQIMIMKMIIKFFETFKK